MPFYIKDFVVVSDYQGKGVGRLLLAADEKYIRENIDHTWAVSLKLTSTKEAVAFLSLKRM